MAAALEVLRLLGDPTRMRLLHLLAQHELSVAELQEILEMGQSRISSHLALLRQGGLVSDRREGKRSYYGLHAALSSPIADLRDQAIRALASEALAQRDLDNLAGVLQRRRQASERYFARLAGKLNRQRCPGRSWKALTQLLAQLTPRIDVADLGSGEGLVAQLLAPRARRVVCVDNAPAMVEAGRRFARENGVENLEFVLGDIEAIPLEDASIDLALLSQALHHAEEPALAIAEAARILRPGGSLLVLDLHEHSFEQARELYADRWLGFSLNAVHQWLQQAGLQQLRVDLVAREEEPPHFETLLACGLKPPSR